MKKIFFLLLFVTSNIILAQNIAFEQVGIEVKPGNGAYVLGLLDDFYGNIEKPEGVNISLNRVYFKTEEKSFFRLEILNKNLEYFTQI